MKHSSLICYEVSFITPTPIVPVIKVFRHLKRSNKLERFSVESLSSLAVTFVSKTGAYPIGVPFWRSSLGQARGLTNKFYV
jgi:hypothetical protein